jgi:molybdopterin converting factor small subunit
MAELKFLGYLVEIAGGRTKTVVVERPTRLRELLPASFPDAHIIILIDDKPGTLDSLIENDSTVAFMPVISGG